MIGRRKPAPTPAPRSRPDADRQCTEIAHTTGQQCTQWTTRGGGPHCHTHARRHTTTSRRPAALTAAVATVQLDGVAWRTWRFGDRAWQREAWRLYDITGQLRFVANWVGNSVSRCRLYVAEVDESGEAGDEAEDPEIASLAAGPLGQGPAKDEALRLLGINLFVVGEAYIVAEADGIAPGEDRWFVVSSRQIRRSGDQITIRRSQLHGGGDMIYRPDVDLILRVWTPHPADTDEPDSPTRSAIPDLREIEAIRKREFAELDSRLSGAGLLPLPEGIDFPRGDDDPPGVEGFSRLLMRAMATSLQNRASAEAMVPIMFTVPGEFLDKIKQVTFWSELSDQLLPLREAAIRSLAQSLDVPAEILLGMGDTNHWCTVRDVEIMARDGWKTYDQLSVGEQVLTLNHDTGLSEWQPLLAVNTWEVVDQRMVSIRGRGHSSLTTLHHRWPTLSGGRWQDNTRAWDTTSGLLERARAATTPDAQMYDYLLLAAPHADLPTQPKYEDALVELVAWYFTEGAAGVRPGRNTPKVTIYQSHHVNPDNCARIYRALTALFGPASHTLDKGGRYASAESVARRAEARRLRAENPTMPKDEIGRRLNVSGTMVAKYLALDAKTADTVPRWRIRRSKDDKMTNFVLNSAAANIILKHAPGRVVSADFIHELTQPQLDLFIDTAIRGDGHVQAGGTQMFGQKDPRMCDAVELAGILSGRYVNRTTVTGIGRSANGPKGKTQHVISIGSRTTFAPRGRSFSEQTYTGTIWCPTTPNGTWLARHEGTVFYTGNSSWQVSEDAVSTQIVPVNSRIADALTQGYIRGALEELGDDPDSHVYALDTGPLTARPNRSADALNYYGAGLLSSTAAVEAGAFRDDQMPDDDERLRRLAERIILGAPALASDPVLRALVGIEGLPPPAEATPAEGPVAEPAQPAPVRDPRALPERTPQTEEQSNTAALVAVSNLATLRALALAGCRLVPPRQRDQWPDTPRHQLHSCQGPITRDEAERVLSGAWEDLPAVTEDLHVDATQLQGLLHGFAVELLTRGMPYDPRLLRDLVAAAVRGRRLDAPVGVAA
jgi:hypothetical protein